MKVLVRKNVSTKTGYELVVIDDNNVETVTPIEEFGYNRDKVADNLHLPANPYGREWCMIKKVVGDELELKPHVDRVLGTQQPRKPDEDFLEGEDRKLYLELKEKIRKAREEANKKPALTELEKAQLAVKRAEEKLAAAKAKAEAESKKESK